MRFVCLLFLLVPLLLCGACKDTPRYTADQVIMVAKSYSPGYCGPCSYAPQRPLPYLEGEKWVYTEEPEPTEPGWYVEYIGKGVWCVEKSCCGVHTDFLFYEDTGKLVKQSQSCRP
jgi:hypothetical protein